MSFRVISRKKQVVVGLSAVLFVGGFFAIGFINQKPINYRSELISVDIFRDPVKETLPLYEALPDDDCVNVVSEHVAAAPQHKIDLVKNTLDAPLVYASAPKCKSTSAFPADYQKLGKDGFVELVLNLDREGKVERGEIEKTSGFPALDESALKQVTDTWNFEPCKKSDKAVACRQKIKFRWKVEENKL